MKYIPWQCKEHIGQVTHRSHRNARGSYGGRVLNILCWTVVSKSWQCAVVCDAALQSLLTSLPGRSSLSSAVSRQKAPAAPMTLAVLLIVAVSTAQGLVVSNPSHVVHLYANGSNEVNQAFQDVYGHFEAATMRFVFWMPPLLVCLFFCQRAFDMELYHNLTGQFAEGLQKYRSTDAYASYELYPTRFAHIVFER